MDKIDEVLVYFNRNIHNLIISKLSENPKLKNEVQEIRVRVNKPIILKTRNIDLIIEYKINGQEILELLEKICENSIYAYKNQICEGFLTIKGGHRIGITGTAVIQDKKIINLNYISSLNFRIAREIIGCSNKVLNEVLDLKNQTIYNTVIVSPPGKGKTTILRDLIRQLSNGIESINFKGKTIGVVDERGEIAATYKGVPQNDVGIRTDIIGNVEKTKGIEMLIRSMAPDIIACDEIGSKEDVLAIEKAMISGVKGIFTMHGKNLEDIKNNHEVYRLIENKKIEKIIFI